jgi:hypothetical protein
MEKIKNGKNKKIKLPVHALDGAKHPRKSTLSVGFLEAS